MSDEIRFRGVLTSWSGGAFQCTIKTTEYQVCSILVSLHQARILVFGFVGNLLSLGVLGLDDEDSESDNAWKHDQAS